MLPNVTEIGVLVNPDFPDAQEQLQLVEKAAVALGLQLHIANANTEGDIDTAFANFSNQKLGAVFIEGGALFLSRRRQLAALAARFALPASYFFLEFGEVGGLWAMDPVSPKPIA